MSVSRLGLVTFVAVLTMISTDGGAIAAPSPQANKPAETAVVDASTVGTRPAPCCGTITGDS